MSAKLSEFFITFPGLSLVSTYFVIIWLTSFLPLSPDVIYGWPLFGACLTVWTEGGVILGGWGIRPPTVETDRNEGLKEEQWSGQQIGPEGRRAKVKFRAEL